MLDANGLNGDMDFAPLLFKPERLFQYDRDYGMSCCLRCPVCGMGQTHALGAWTRVGSDDGEAVVYPGTQPLGITTDRRSALVLAFSCEDGHRFALIIQQHKGNNFCSLESWPDRPVDADDCFLPDAEDSFYDWLADQELLAQIRLLRHKRARLALQRKQKENRP